MGIVSKEGYERKAEYAARRMEENKKIKSLTEEEHDMLAELCSLRHKIHTSIERLWVEDTEHLLEQLFEFNPGTLPPLKLSMDIADIPSENDYYGNVYGDKDDYEDYIDWFEHSEHYEEYCDVMNTINNEIESYLHEIDMKHGTNYCPTGMTRLY